MLLEPCLAQTIALAIHELATNAAKYGSLTAASGKVSLSWAIERNSLAVEWRKRGPAVSSSGDLKAMEPESSRGASEQLGGLAEF